MPFAIARNFGLVKGIRLEWMRMARWLLVPLSMEFISHLPELPFWPHLLHLP
jgi:hypothetical protein